MIPSLFNFSHYLFHLYLHLFLSLLFSFSLIFSLTSHFSFSLCFHIASFFFSFLFIPFILQSVPRLLLPSFYFYPILTISPYPFPSSSLSSFPLSQVSSPFIPFFLHSISFLFNLSPSSYSLSISPPLLLF